MVMSLTNLAFLDNGYIGLAWRYKKRLDQSHRRAPVFMEPFRSSCSETRVAGALARSIFAFFLSRKPYFCSPPLMFGSPAARVVRTAVGFSKETMEEAEGTVVAETKTTKV